MLTYQERKDFVDLMIQVRGENYALGYLSSFFASNDSSADIHVNSLRDELLVEKLTNGTKQNTP